MQEPKISKQTPFYLLMFVQMFSAMQKGGIEAQLSPDIIELVFEKFNKINTYYDHKRFYNSILTMLPLIGQFIGSILLPLFKNYFGYKKASFYSIIGFIIVQTLNMIPINIWVTFTTSFCAGIFAAINAPLLLLFIGELSEKQLRGKLGVIYEIFVGLGNMMCSCALLGINYNWRIRDHQRNMFYFTYLPGIIESILCLIFLYFLPSVGTHAERETSEITIKQLFKKQYIKPMAIAALIGIWQQASGIYAMTIYATEIFADYFDTQLSSAIGQLIVNAGKTIPTICDLFMVETLGRKKLVCFGSSLCVIGLFIVVIGYGLLNPKQSVFNTLLMTGHVVFLIGYALAPGPFTFVLTSEIYPKSAKGKLSSIQMIFFYFCSVTVVGLFETMQSIDKWLPYFCYLLCMTGSATALLLLIPETKGKSQDEIETELMGQQFEENEKILFSEQPTVLK